MNQTPKQVIIMRTDLNMRKGKMAAQASHASMAILLDRMRDGMNRDQFNLSISQPHVYSYDMTLRINKEKDAALHEWLTGRFTKIVVGCGSEEELFELLDAAVDANLPQVFIQDAGLTEFGGIPTVTCGAIGPGNAELIDKITGHLKLL